VELQVFLSAETTIRFASVIDTCLKEKDSLSNPRKGMPSQVKSSQGKPSQAKPSQAKPKC
jgi:hypothetical protein